MICDGKRYISGSYRAGVIVKCSGDCGAEQYFESVDRAAKRTTEPCGVAL